MGLARYVDVLTIERACQFSEESLTIAPKHYPLVSSLNACNQRYDVNNVA